MLMPLHQVGENIHFSSAHVGARVLQVLYCDTREAEQDRNGMASRTSEVVPDQVAWTLTVCNA